MILQTEEPPKDNSYWKWTIAVAVATAAATAIATEGSKLIADLIREQLKKPDNK